MVQCGRYLELGGQLIGPGLFIFGLVSVGLLMPCGFGLMYLGPGSGPLPGFGL